MGDFFRVMSAEIVPEASCMGFFAVFNDVKRPKNVTNNYFYCQIDVKWLWKRYWLVASKYNRWYFYMFQAHNVKYFSLGSSGLGKI